MADTTTIRIYEDDADRLHALKKRGESYADVVSRLDLETTDEQHGNHPTA